MIRANGRSESLSVYGASCGLMQNVSDHWKQADDADDASANRANDQ